MTLDDLLTAMTIATLAVVIMTFLFEEPIR